MSPAPPGRPTGLRVARDALQAARVDDSRQESRLLVLRDFRPVAQALAGAQAQGTLAARLGDERRETARAAAEQAVLEAREFETHALALVAVTTLPPAQRTQLLRARLLLREAELLSRAGELRAARERALGAQTELRRAVGPALAAAERYRSQSEIATWRRWIEDTSRVSRADRRARDRGAEGEEPAHPAGARRAGPALRRRGGAPTGSASNGARATARRPRADTAILEEGTGARASTTARCCSTTRTRRTASASRPRGAGRDPARLGDRGADRDPRRRRTRAATGPTAAWRSGTPTWTTCSPVSGSAPASRSWGATAGRDLLRAARRGSGQRAERGVGSRARVTRRGYAPRRAASRLAARLVARPGGRIRTRWSVRPALVVGCSLGRHGMGFRSRTAPTRARPPRRRARLAGRRPGSGPGAGACKRRCGVGCHGAWTRDRPDPQPPPPDAGRRDLLEAPVLGRLRHGAEGGRGRAGVGVRHAPRDASRCCPRSKTRSGRSPTGHSSRRAADPAGPRRALRVRLARRVRALLRQRLHDPRHALRAPARPARQPRLHSTRA